MGIVLFPWIGRSSSIVIFVSGCLQLAPPPMPQIFPNGLSAIFFFVVAMILLVTGELIGTILRDLNVLRQTAYQTPIEIAKDIFSVFGMATRAISDITTTTAAPQKRASTTKPQKRASTITLEKRASPTAPQKRNSTRRTTKG